MEICSIRLIEKENNISYNEYCDDVLRDDNSEAQQNRNKDRIHDLIEAF